MNRLRPTWRWGAPAIAVVFALVFAVPALVGDAPDSVNDVPAGFAPGEAGLRAAIDPETGELAIGADALRILENQRLQNDKAEQMLIDAVEDPELFRLLLIDPGRVRPASAGGVPARRGHTHPLDKTSAAPGCRNAGAASQGS